MATDKEYKAVIEALSGECERLHKENEELKKALKNHDTFMKYAYSQGKQDALSQEPCDAISRDELLKAIDTWDKFGCDADTKLVRYQDHYVPYIHYDDVIKCIKNMPSVTQKSGKCKNCKYFEYDSVAKVDGIPLIVAHEICNKWGDGCKTNEDGYCYLFEPQERSDKE